MFFGHLYTSKVSTKNVHLRLYNVVCGYVFVM